MQSIRIAEPAHPAKQYSGDGAGSTYGDAATVGGVYPMRRLSKVLSQKSFKSVEQAEDEDAGLRQASDFKKRQVLEPTPALHARLRLTAHSSARDRSSLANSSSGSPTNPSASSMAISARVRSTSFPRPLPRSPRTRISSASFPLSSGPSRSWSRSNMSLSSCTPTTRERAALSAHILSSQDMHVARLAVPTRPR